MMPRGFGEQFTYSIKTNERGASIGVSPNEDRSQYNIRISWGSFACAMRGLSGAVTGIREVCEALGAVTWLTDPLDCTKVSRLDYATDYTAEGDWEPDPDMMVTRRPMGTWDYADPDGGADIETRRLGRRVKGMRIGAISNRQVVIYDKVADTVVKRKQQLMEAVWRKRLCDLGAVWRVEVRAGRGALEAARARDLANLYDHGRAALLGTIANIRYTTGGRGDSNRSRWPSAAFWGDVRDRVVAWDIHPPEAGAVQRCAAAEYQAKRDAYRAAAWHSMAGLLAEAGETEITPDTIAMAMESVFSEYAPTMLDRLEAKRTQKAEELERLRNEAGLSSIPGRV